MQKYNIEFEQSAHVYKVEGKKIPSVSEIIYDTLNYYNNFAEEHATRGKEIHHLTTLIDSNTIDFSSVKPEYLDYLSAYSFFIGQVEGIENSEFKVYNKLWNYCGTIDRILTLKNKLRCIVDLKTGATAKHHGLQLAAYSMAYQESGYSEKRLPIIAVHLANSGKFNFKEYNLDRECAAWQACLSLYRWKNGV